MPAHAVREERHFVISHPGFRQLFHPAMDVEQAVVGINNILAVDKQAEVARLVRRDVQRPIGTTLFFLLPSSLMNA